MSFGPSWSVDQPKIGLQPVGANGPDGSGLKPASACWTDVCENAVNAVRAVGAFIAAYPCTFAVWRKVAVA